MSTVQVTIAYGPEYAGVPVRLYGSLDSGSQASLPFTPVNIGSLVLKTDSLVLIAQSVLGENGKVTFQWDETEHDVVIYQAAAQLVSGWRLSNPLIIPSNLVPPDITSHPTGGEYDGETAFTLTVVATGSEPLSYQWYIGSSGVTDTPVAGATGASYDAEPEEDTMYWCRVTNVAGSADSNTALVTVPVPTVQMLGSPVACSSSSIHETMFSWALAAATEYIIEVNAAMTSADNAADWVGSLVIPTGATGRWSAAGGVSYNSGGGELTDTATISRTQTTNTPLIVRIRILTDEAGTLTLRFLTGTNGQAVTVAAGSAALLRTSPNVVKLADAVATSSTVTFSTVLQVPCAADAKTWIDIELHYSTTDTTHCPDWELSADNGATFFAALANTLNDAADTSYNATRRDATETAMVITKAGMNVVRFRLLVVTTTAATFTLKVKSDDAAELSVLAGSWARYADVTGTVNMLEADVRHESTTPEDTFTHAVAANSVYWIAGCAGYLLETTTITIKIDSDGIPVGATMLMLDQVDYDGNIMGMYVATDGTDKHGFGSGSTTIEQQWQYDGILVTGANGGMFKRRHGTEAATWHVDVKAGSFSLAELVKFA